MSGIFLQLEITEKIKPSKKHTEITQLNQPMLDPHTDQVHKLETQKNHQAIPNHLMIKKSKLELKDQPGSPLTVMIFSKDQFITTTLQETGSQKEELKLLLKKPSPPIKDFMVQDSPNI
jgi:hypothetical protein